MVGKAEAVAAAVEVNHNELKALVKLYFKARRALFCWGDEVKLVFLHPCNWNREVPDSEAGRSRDSRSSQAGVH